MYKLKKESFYKTPSFMLVLLTLLFFGCDPSKLLVTEDPADQPVVLDIEMGDEVYLWISSDKDSYVSCGPPSGNCPEQNFNFGTNSSLVVANSAVAIKKSYVHFTLPNLPSGSQIKEAYLELYHSGKNEDGKSDNILIPVGLASDDWSPMTLTYANEPNRSFPSEEFSIKLRSQDWSGTQNISRLIQELIFTSKEFRGFQLYWPYQSQGIEKGFYSNNYIGRTVGDMGLAPRLLIKLTLPASKTVADISLPQQLPSDTDLNFPGQLVTMMQFVTGGNNWPASWDVASIK